MTGMRVVVYAEGGLDDSRRGLNVAPGEPLPEERLGVVHLLVRRCIAEAGVADVVFEAPLNPGARPLRGSRLLHCPSLRRALTWPSPAASPDLAVVFVDEDGERARAAMLRDCLGSRKYPRPPVVAALCVHELESWLIADHATVQRVLGCAFDQPAAPESLRPGEAKRILAEWAALAGSDAVEARRAIARNCAIDVLTRTCSAFGKWVSELRSSLAVEGSGRR